MTAKPQPRALSPEANGAIFQTADYRPLLEDNRPTMVGDTLTVTIQEQTTTSATEQVSESRASAINENISGGVQLPFIPTKLTSGINSNLNTTGGASQTGKGSNQLATSFVSSITVTVIDVLANGNLQVSGEKQVRINDDVESIRLSGVVNPFDIQNRTVSSLKVSDARIEQETKGDNRLYNNPGWLTKIFLSILPF
jgi:flagellar L-ring protein precursor FlgH